MVKLKVIALGILWVMSCVCLWYNLENKHELELIEQQKELNEVHNKQVDRLMKENKSYEKTIASLRSDLDRVHKLNDRITSQQSIRPILRRCSEVVSSSSETITRQQELIGKYNRNLKALKENN